MFSLVELPIVHPLTFRVLAFMLNIVTPTASCPVTVTPVRVAVAPVVRLTIEPYVPLAPVVHPVIEVLVTLITPVELSEKNMFVAVKPEIVALVTVKVVVPTSNKPFVAVVEPAMVTPLTVVKALTTKFALPDTVILFDADLAVMVTGLEIVTAELNVALVVTTVTVDLATDELPLIAVNAALTVLYPLSNESSASVAPELFRGVTQTFGCDQIAYSVPFVPDIVTFVLFRT